MNKKIADIILSFFCFSFSGYILYVVKDVTGLEKIFPLVISIGLIVCGGVILFIRLKDHYEKETDNNKYKLIFIMISILIAYGFCLDKIGYIISTIILVISIMILLKNKNIKRIFAVSFGTVLLVFLLFSVALNVPLPTLF